MEIYPLIPKEISEQIAENEAYESFSMDEVAPREKDCEWFRTIVVSLYALQPFARPEVLKILEKYKKDLRKRYTAKEIASFIKEYQDMILFYEFTDGGILSQKKFGDYIAIPSPVMEMCLKMASPTKESDILLPHAGLGQIMYKYTNNPYYGYESSPEAWAFLQIVLDSFGFDDKIQNCEFEEAMAGITNQYDYIFSFQPTNTINARTIKEIISLATYFLKEGGQMYWYLPYSFMFGKKWVELREFITSSNDFEIEVIALPSNLHDKSRVRTCVLCLKKNHTGKVTLIDASELGSGWEYQENPHNESLSTVERLINAVEGKDGKYVWHGMTSDLRNDKSLLPSLYMMNQYWPIPNKGEKLIELSELIKIVRAKEPLLENCYIFTKKDFPTNYMNCDIQLDKLGKPFWNVDFKSVLLRTNTILYYFYGLTPKVSRFKSCNKRIAIEKDIIPLRLISQDIITEDFLLRALTLDETSRQARIFSPGFMGCLSYDDFLKLKIIVPSIERQNEICMADSRALLSESENRLMQEYEDFRRDMHMKKHSIGQTICSFKDWWDILKNAHENGINDDNAIVGNNMSIKVSQIYENLEIAMSKLQHQIYSMNRGNGMIPENIALTEFIEDYIQRNQNPLFRYIYESEDHRWDTSLDETISEEMEESSIDISNDNDINDGDPKEYVKFPREALEIIFDNIISNACAHGFANRKRGNKIKIDIKTEDTKYILSIANNGEPLNPELTSKDVFTYGKTSQANNNHFGIGGYEVYRLMREFDGDAECILTPNEEFTVTYNLIFNDTNVLSSLEDNKIEEE